MLGRTDSRRRLLFLMLVFAIGSLALIARTAYWQVLRGEELVAQAAAQTSIRIEIPSRRGDIYDRSGTVLFATTVDRDRLVVAGDQLTDAAAEANLETLTRLLELGTGQRPVEEAFTGVAGRRRVGWVIRRLAVGRRLQAAGGRDQHGGEPAGRQHSAMIVAQKRFL